MRARRRRVLAVALLVGAGVASDPVAAPAEGPPPLLSIWEADVPEGNAGDVALTFEIELSAPSASTIEVTFHTADGAATAPGDYTAHTELVTFPPGTTSRTVSVTGHGDTTSEAHEYFIAYIADPVGAVNFKDVAYGTMVEDDIPTTPTIRTVAGTGLEGCCNDGFLVLGQLLSGPAGLAVESDGRIAYTDSTFNLISRFVLGGVVERVGGIPDGLGECGEFDGTPSLERRYTDPYGLASLPDGSLLVTSTWQHEIRRIDPDGTMHRVAGLCPRTHTVPLPNLGDGGPARDARLHSPRGVAVGAGGEIYISDSGQHRIRRIAVDGTITTIAGTGVAGFSGDGGPATAAQLRDPWGIAVAPNGDVYVADWGNNRVRRITPAGTIHTVAGTGAAGFSGDGGPATAAALNQPTAVAVASDGTVYVADSGNHVVRQIGATGTITTIVGSAGVSGYLPDATDPADALLRYPAGLVVDELDRLYIASSHSVILEVAGL